MRRKTVGAVAALSIIATVGGALVGGCPQGPGGSGSGGLPFNLPPTPIISFDIDRGVAPLTVNFGSDRSTDDGLIVTRVWEFGDGTTSRDISPQHTYTSNGNFEVTLTLTDDGGATSTRRVTIIVTEAPVAVLNVNATASEFAPASFSFDASDSFDPDGEIVSVEWDFGDGSSALLAEIDHVYANPGTYKVVLTVTDNAGVTGTAEEFIQLGIRQPRIEIRVPPADAGNIAVSPDSSLWIQAVYDVDPSADVFIRAGIDADRDQCEAQAALFNADTGEAGLVLLGHGAKVNQAVFSPDGTNVLTASSDGSLRLQNATTGDLVRTYPNAGDVQSVAFSPDGTRFVFGRVNGDVVLVETATGTILLTLLDHGAAVNDVAFSPDGSQLLSASDDARAILWNAADGSVLRDFVHPLPIRAVAFSPADPTLVATGSEDGTVQLWNTTGGAATLVIAAHASEVNALAFSPDGLTLLSGGGDNLAKLWNPLDGSLIQTFSGHSNNVLSVAFNADGGTVITGSADGSARVWDSATGGFIRALQPCVSAVSSAVFSPDGAQALLGVAASNSIVLDTDPPNGGDLNITYPAALKLDNVPSLRGGRVPPGQYFLWAEIATDRTDAPVRTYAPQVISVVRPYTSQIDPNTPLIPLVNDTADVVVAPTSARQVFDLGPLSQGDRIFMSMLTVPGYSEVYDFGARDLLTAFVGGEQDFSFAILNENGEIFAWYQPDFILFSRETKLVIARRSEHYYVAVDGGVSLRFRIQRESGQFETRAQRVFVNFAGAAQVRVADTPATNVPPLDASDFDPSWGDSETTIIKNQIVATLNQKFEQFNVQFVTSDQVLADPSLAPKLPALRMHFGGFSDVGAFGIADYIDPRNDTLGGEGIIYATEIALTALFGFFENPVTTPTQVGAVIGTVGAHEIGHLLGLRHTLGNPLDIMATGLVNDPTRPLIFTTAEIFFLEQPDPSEPPIGIQNAEQTLFETVGPR